MQIKLLLLLLVLSFKVIGQTPTVQPIADVSEFAGSQVCVDAPLVNTGPPGFAPYIQLIVPIGVTFDSADIFGSSATITNVGTFPAAPGNQLTDTIIDASVTAPEGFQLILIQPPIGSLVDGAPPLNLELCFTIDPTADIGVPLGVSITPVFELGDTATGDNGPIIGATVPFNITPILVEFMKENDALEAERPPGPSWPVNYTLTADIAPGSTLDNVVITDVLPANFVLDVGSLMVTGGTGCVFNAPDITLNCTSATGTVSAADLVVTYSGFFSDALDEAVCDSSLETNNATFDADYLAMPIAQETATSDVLVQHVTIQKGAGPDVVAPGDTVTYNLNLQVTDFGTSDSLVLTDVLPDGVTFDAHGALTVGGAGVAIVPTVQIDTPANGQTTVIYDITAVTGNIAPGTAINVTYTSTVDATYFNGEAILANDPLSNTVVSTFGLTAGASGCTNGSAAAVTVQPTTPTKTVITTGPYEPGDTVTYRLTLAIPSGDTQDVVFTDFFPLPVFDATDIDLIFGNDITNSPADTLGLTPTLITSDGATNSLRIEWPDVTTGSPQVLSVDVDVSITTDPFADDLNLANLLQIESANSPGTVTTGVVPVSIQVRAPELVITKGVLSADQGTIAPAATILPVDGDVSDVDANDDVTYQITVENTGGAPAFDVLITDAAVAGLTGCAIDSVTDGNGGGLAFTGNLVIGISLTDPLAGNDDMPVGGGAPFSDDTALVNITCQVAANAEYNTSVTNTATVTYAAAVAATSYPIESDEAELTTASPTIDKTILSVSPNVDGVNNTITVGETIQYQVVITLPEGQGNNAELVDLLDNGLVFDSFDSITTSSADVTSSVGFPAALTAAGTLNTRNGLIALGTINNNNTDNAVPESITVVYTVLVTDVGANQPGGNRNNRADFNTDTTTVRDTAPNRQIREPLITVNKVATPTMADAGDTISYTITVSNNGRPTNRLSPAFDVVLEDLLADLDLTLVATTVVASQGTVTTGNTAGDTTIDVDVGTLAINGSMTVTFDAIISNTVESGDTVANTATVSNYSSLPGGGRVYPDVDGDATVAIDAAITAKTVLGVTSTEQSDGINTRGDGSLVDLTIGEEVTFEITTTLAEGVSPSVIITDNLPNNAAGQMEYVSANIISVGANLTPTDAAPPAVPTLPSSVSFDFGSVTNTADGTVDADDQIVIQVTGRVTDIVANAGIEELINNVIVQFNTGLNATAQATIEVVEPVMSIDKTSITSTADAGDTITYVMTIDNLLANGTSANAFDVTLTDNIPAGLTFAGNLSTDSGLAPDVGTLQEAGGVISATWTNYPIGSSTVISFDVTVDNTVTPSQTIQNTAGIVWNSLPGSPVVERTSSDSDPHIITISETGLIKLVTDTSEPSTGIAINGAEDDLTIGEQVTYRFIVSFPEGTTPNAVVVDQLPTGSSILSVVSSTIVSIGGQLSPTMGAVGDSGTVTNTDADVYDDRIEWTFGDIFNSPDGLSDTNDEVLFEVVALVVDDAVNQGGANDVVNTASLTYTGGNRSGTALVDIVEPRLSITKATLPAVVLGDAGDVIDYELTIEHLGASNADAFNLTITDLLPDPGASWINDGTFSSTCGAVVNSSGDPFIEFTINQLTLATGTCTINYQVVVDVAVKPGASYTNNVVMDYDSTPVFVAGATRRSSDASSATFNIGVPSITKTVTSTSLNDTGTGIGDMMTEDLAIGELVDYVITITVPEGTSNNSTLLDNLPVDASGGVMEVTAAVVTSIGANITTTLAGTPVFSNTDADGLNDQVLFDFGNIVNTPDMVVDAGDQIIVTITGRITDDGLNNAVETYINDALFTFGIGGNTISDSADVELVEPNLGLTKSMGTPVNSVVPIQLTLTNTAGTASAYDLTLVDVLDGNIWDLSSISATNIPTGFDFVVTPGPGPIESTVTISSNGALPASSIEPNEVLVFEFTAEIRDDVPLPSSIDNTATLTEASSMPGADAGERDYSDIVAMDTLQLSDLDATKTDALVVDNGTIGEANPDDTIRYTIEIENFGGADANAVVFSDAPDVNTTLVAGSVTSSQGTVTTGNTGGDTAVVVDIGTIIPAATITITFDVTINNPFPVGVTEISNQGLIESNEFPPEDTDDPDTGPDDDPTITPIGAGHDLEITKDDGGITAQAGDTIIYTLNYANIGNQNTTGVVITETVPNTTVFNAASSSVGWSCANGSPAGTSCTLAIGDLDGGASGSADFAVDVFDPKPAGVTEILNSVSIADDGNNGPEDDTGNNGDNDNTPIDAAPDLTLTKTSNGLDAAPGGTIVYTLTYQNIGTQGATGVVITDAVPTNTTFNTAGSTIGWSCVDGDPAGTVCTFNVAGTVAADDPAVGVQFAVTVDNPLAAGVTQVSNSASINDDGNNGADTDPSNNNDDENTNINAVPDLTVTKDDGGITAGAGDTISYTINYSNIGNQEATGVVLTETVPDNTTFNAGASDAWVCVPNINAGSVCTLNVGSVLGGGGNGTATFAVDVDAPKPSGVTLISNNISIADDGNNGPEDTSNNVDVDTTPVDAAPDLTLMKTSQTNVVSAGGTLIYDLVYENIGTQNATGVIISDTVPLNSVFNAANSTPTWSCADGSIAGTVCTLTIGNVDVGSGAETVQFAISLIDPLPAGADEIINNASIADDGTNGDDLNPDDNADDDTTDIGAAPDLVITKMDVVDLVEAGGIIVYQLSYSNIGNQDSTGVVITETVPAETTFNAASSTAGWSCADNSVAGTVCLLNVGDVNAGDVAVIVEFAVNVPNPIPAGVDTVSNNVSIADDGNNGDDADTSNNNDDEETTIGAFPDLRITKTDNDVTSAPGNVVVYVLSYGNDGTQDSTGVIITETVPANTTFDVSGSSVGWVCLPSNLAGSTCEFNVGNLNAGDTGLVNFAVLIDDPLAPGVNEIFNQVSIADDGNNGDDINPDNDLDDDVTSVLLDPPVGIKTGNLVNDFAEWRIYWFNPNNNRDLPVFIYDPIPENSSYVEGSATCVANGSSTCTMPVFIESLNQIELNAIISPDEGAPINSTEDMLNNEIVITFQTRIIGAGPVTVSNQAEANWDEDNDGDPNNDADDGQDPVVTDAPDTADIGDPTVLRAFFPVPTLSFWGLLLMMACFMGLLWCRRREFGL